MRLARLVVAGLVLGAFTGFLSALLRPRSAPGADCVDMVGTAPRWHLPAVRTVVLDDTKAVPSTAASFTVGQF